MVLVFFPSIKFMETINVAVNLLFEHKCGLEFNKK